MRKSYIRHDNLRKIIEKFYEGEEIADGDIERFIEELKHSCLIIAADQTDSNLLFRTYSDEDGDYGLLFTDMDEFQKTFSTDVSQSHYFNFDVYKDIISQETLDGFIINPLTEGFVLRKDLFKFIRDMPESEWDCGEAYTTDELVELRRSIDNHDLDEFIKNPSNIGKYDELFEKISNSTLLTLMLSYDDLDEYSDGNVINLSEVGPLGFLYIDEIGGKYATVYTSEDKISNVDTPLNRYSQIVNFSKMCNFILNDDMDGVIINPQDENILLSRDVLLEHYSFLEKTCNDVRLNSAILYLFLMEEI